MTEVAADVNKTIEKVARENPDINVFTDGFGMEGKVGTRAVLYRSGRLKMKL